MDDMTSWRSLVMVGNRQRGSALIGSKSKFSPSWNHRKLLIEHREKIYVAVKIGVAQFEPVENFDTWDSNEMAAHQELGKLKTSHRGCLSIRSPERTFPILSTIEGGWHLCIALEPALCDLATLRLAYDSGIIEDIGYIKAILKELILALDFLHTEAGIVHCDIKADNVLLAPLDDSVCREVARALKKYRPKARWDGARLVYESLNLSAFLEGIPWAPPKLSDFGEARAGVALGGQLEPEIIGAGPYRAPEARLGLRWGSAVDIWALGVMAWWMVHGNFPFPALNPHGTKNAPYLASMTALLGPPPKEILEESTIARDCWGANGAWQNSCGVSMPAATSLEEMEDKLEGDEKAAFLGFIRSTLQWKSEDRKTAAELVDDPWLNSS